MEALIAQKIGRAWAQTLAVRFGRKASYPLDGLILKPVATIVNKKIHEFSHKMQRIYLPKAPERGHPARFGRAGRSRSGALGRLGDRFLSDFVKKITNFRLTFFSGV
jgi:hypothetical protein